jgi:hypothetical protein
MIGKAPDFIGSGGGQLPARFLAQDADVFFEGVRLRAKKLA